MLWVFVLLNGDYQIRAEGEEIILRQDPQPITPTGPGAPIHVDLICDLGSESRVTSIVVRARCSQPAQVRIMTFDPAGQESHTPFSIIKDDGQWHVTLIPVEGSFMR